MLKLICLCALFFPLTLRAVTSVEDFSRREQFQSIKLSPDGAYIALTYPVNKETGLVVIRLSDHVVMSKITVGKDRGVAGFWWISTERLVVTVAEDLGPLSKPIPTGELLAVNADGSGQRYLFGFRGNLIYWGERSKSTYAYAAAWVLDPLPREPKSLLVATSSFSNGELSIVKLDAETGRREVVDHSPLRGDVTFLTDRDGALRYAAGTDNRGYSLTYGRRTPDEKWQLLNTGELKNAVIEPLGISGDGTRAFLKSNEDGDRYCLVEQNLGSGARTMLSCDNDADFDHAIFSFDGSEPIAAIYLADRPQTRLLETKHPDRAKLEALMRSFPGQLVEPVSSSLDGGTAVILVQSDRNPGDYYLFDTSRSKAQYVISRLDWIAPEEMAERRPVQFKARDGQVIHGYLTLPPGAAETGLPLVVNPHGGPFSVADNWAWDADAQFLASRGYAVLQVNFRGSGGFGTAFRNAGRKAWDSVMIDDITDATHWAVSNGFADPRRLCIYGASYGGYAALMSVVREPSLYRCAIGYAGVYDLPLLKKESEISSTLRGQNYFSAFIGSDQHRLEEASPVNHLDRLKAALMIVHGTEDKRAPYSQAQSLMEALNERRYPYERLVKWQEGHGFFAPKNRREFYEKLVTFLERNLTLPKEPAPAQ